MMDIEDLKDDIREIKELLLIQNNKNDEFLKNITMTQMTASQNKIEIKNLKGLVLKIVIPIFSGLTILGGVITFLIK